MIRIKSRIQVNILVFIFHYILTRGEVKEKIDKNSTLYEDSTLAGDRQLFSGLADDILQNGSPGY